VQDRDGQLLTGGGIAEQKQRALVNREAGVPRGFLLPFIVVDFVAQTY
jgi:hypothetical protein